MISKVRLVALVAVFLLILAGCAGVTKKQVSKEEINKVKSIVIVKVHNIEEYQLNDFGNPLGAIGAAVNAATKTDTLNEILASNGFDFASQMETELKAHLESAGYTVQVADVKKENPRKLLENYKGVNIGNADAVIDVAIRVIGYASITITDPDYRPYLDMLVNLKGKQGNLIYGDHILYGGHNPFMDAHEIESPKEYFYADFDSLTKDPAAAATGMKTGVSKIVEYIVGNLAKRT
jgi:hypothetical protein